MFLLCFYFFKSEPQRSYKHDSYKKSVLTSGTDDKAAHRDVRTHLENTHAKRRLQIVQMCICF